MTLFDPEADVRPVPLNCRSMASAYRSKDQAGAGGLEQVPAPFRNKLYSGVDVRVGVGHGLLVCPAAYGRPRLTYESNLRYSSTGST